MFTIYHHKYSVVICNIYLERCMNKRGNFKKWRWIHAFYKSVDSCQGWNETKFPNKVKTFLASPNRAEITALQWGCSYHNANPTTHSAQCLCLCLREELSSKPVQTLACCGFETGIQEDDHHSEVPALPASKARAQPSEMNSVVLDQMAACDITMPNLIFTNSSNPGLQFPDAWPQVCLSASKGNWEIPVILKTSSAG